MFYSPLVADSEDRVEGSIETGVLQDDACFSQDLPPSPLLAISPTTWAKSLHSVTEDKLGLLRRRGTIC